MNERYKVQNKNANSKVDILYNFWLRRWSLAPHQ